MDPTYPLYPIFAFLGFFIVLIPLPWHLQAWNSGTCAFMMWTAATCLVQFINAIVWKDNVRNVAPVWCDISAQILLAQCIGIPASILCISRRLYKITSIQTVSITHNDKRRAVLIDLCIAVGIPILVSILHIIVHPHRFDIIEEIGCYPVTYNTLPAYFLYYSWPIILGCVSFVYSSMTLRSFYLRRAQFTTLINSTANKAMNMNRYIRLMALAVIDMACTVPMGAYVMYISTTGVPLAPWISWEETHFDFGRVGLIPSLIWRNDPLYNAALDGTRWTSVALAFLFFGLFGFASEAKKHYKFIFWWCAKRVGYQRKTASPKFILPSSNHSSKPKEFQSPFAVAGIHTVSSAPPKRKGSSFSSPDQYAYDPYGATYSSEVARPYGIDTEIHPMSPTTYKVISEWEHAQEVERSVHIYAKKTPPPGSPSTSTLPACKSEAGSTACHSDVVSTRSTVQPSAKSAPSFVNDMGVDTARYSTRAEGSPRFSMDSIEISDSRPASPSQFSDDFKQPSLPSFPQLPPYVATRPCSVASYSTPTSAPGPASSFRTPAHTPVRHVASAPESMFGVRVTVDTARHIL